MFPLTRSLVGSTASLAISEMICGIKRGWSVLDKSVIIFLLTFVSKLTMSLMDIRPLLPGTRPRLIHSFRMWSSLSLFA